MKFLSPRCKKKNKNFLRVVLLCALKRKTGKLLGMSSCKEAREMLLLNHDMKVINDKELLLLLDDNTSRNP